MGGCLLICILLSFAATPPTGADQSVPEFFRQLFADIRSDYASVRASEYAHFCASQGLDQSSAVNEETYLRIRFFHDLLTCTNARDCTRGGILEIPYFWHWIDPNPRHSILLLPDSLLLSDLPPPQPYEQYQTYADVDRVPALYLGDLVSSTPKYAHPACGSFFTFGWCSEREMSFVAMTSLLGHVGKIRQSGIHTYSELWCEFESSTGNVLVLSARVDNTFDSVQWQSLLPGTSQDSWLRDVGAGTQITWYNRKARSQSQSDALRTTKVTSEARERILGQVSARLREADTPSR